ncbi:threonylcarbamoyl-AMP synthase [Thioclava sp. SK-1]|uniref:L-threonylcarbamoyladenylate synthase n=1 Tax=Thioclava sp. SK-1 TaxID=1889770 RepID=UPI000825A7D0|nr:L-threonylcarbamoyladenylate synthase [Thioclava sp. SK-1]OCX66893.1 threonylcarbamoyl-AMP synthase [Thioclava sp. SK-1]
MCLETETLSANDAGIDRAAQLLRASKLVAFPTETVYGLGGSARSDSAVAGIYAAKGRPSFNPLIAHVACLDMAEDFAEISNDVRSLAAIFWPGPLTLVLPLRAGSGISQLVTAGLGTVAVRVPAHPVARRLLRQVDGPVAAPSANISGKISPTTAGHVLNGLSGKISAVLDGGPCAVGVESTILSLDPPRLLRPGGISTEALQTALGRSLPTGGDAAAPNAPGQLLSHYAPGAPVRLNATEAQPNELWIGFGPGCPGQLTLSASGDLLEAAANLFATLHSADALTSPPNGPTRIAVAPIPERGLGRAINDRLRRAAAPRD